MSAKVPLHFGLLVLLIATLSASPADTAPSSPDIQVQKLKDELVSQMALSKQLRTRNEELEKQLLQMHQQLQKLESQLKAPTTNWAIPPLNMPRFLPDGRAVPPNWNERQFNGVPFYIVPLEQSRGATR